MNEYIMDTEGESFVFTTCVAKKRKLSVENDSVKTDHKLAKIDIPSVGASTTLQNEETSIELPITRSSDAPKDPVCYFDLLSDDVLLILLLYLNSTDLYHLSLLVLESLNNTCSLRIRILIFFCCLQM